MASVQNQAPNVDLFDAYFRRADLDRDGRISGPEAVAFFQGSGLTKQVLAQIWALADQRQSGFLGRAEFYNALKLITVAQSKRELTPQIVKAALYGPAAAKIPAPQINMSAIPPSQFNSVAAAPAPPSSGIPTSSQSLGLRGPQVSPNLNNNHQQAPPQQILSLGPPQATSTTTARPMPGFATQGFSGAGNTAGHPPSNPSFSNDWVRANVAGVQTMSSQAPSPGIAPPTTQVGFGPTTSVSTAIMPPRPQAASGMQPSGSPQTPNLGITPPQDLVGFGLATSGPTALLPSRPQAASGIQTSGPPAKEFKPMGITGNGIASDSFFGGDVFSATPSSSKLDSSSSAVSARNVTASPGIVSVPSATQLSIGPGVPDSSRGSFPVQPVGGQLPNAQSLLKPNQQVLTPPTSSGVQHPVSSQSQQPWPKMSQTDVQKYTKVFVEVDKDRDGKITGEEARNLFLSWRLPREILKQVWDLSDQDNDSMLSVREFCVALYLMERYREGRPLPSVLPSNIIFELPSSGQPVMNYNNAAWRPPTGFQQPRGVPVAPALHTGNVAARPPRPPGAPKTDDGLQTTQQKSKVPVLEKHLIDQLSTEEQNSLNSKLHEATEAAKKVEELEKEIVDSRAKIEYCQTKMQELVLYKSRCDNRLNEITERVSADKREAESLAKKYEEKCKQLGDVASRLTLEEATFRDLQEKKMELYKAIVKMENGGADDTLQERADRIQSDLDELVKALNERCKSYGLRCKPTTVTELPYGWQPGIQEGAADWDEDWDKFEEEGFTLVKELTLDVQNILARPKEKSKVVRKETVESPRVASFPNGDVKGEKPHTVDDTATENGSANNNKAEDGSAKSAPSSPIAGSGMESRIKSAPNSPAASSIMGSPKDLFSSNFGMASGFDSSPRDKETQSEHGGGGSIFSGDKSFDEPNWGTFDTNDDVDSAWGFNASSTTKKLDHERNSDDYFFGSEELGLNPIRTGSPHGSSGLFPKKSTFFDDSVPSTPLSLFSTGNSPGGFNKQGSENTFDSFSRFDSFNMSDGGLFASRETPREAFARFDSMRSNKDFDTGHGFSSFDDSDPFGTSGPFKDSSLTNQTPRSGLENNWSAF